MQKVTSLDYLQPELKKLGYQGHWKQKLERKDGSCIFFKEDK
jgi:hypothetical protein